MTRPPRTPGNRGRSGRTGTGHQPLPAGVATVGCYLALEANRVLGCGRRSSRRCAFRRLRGLGRHRTGRLAGSLRGTPGKDQQRKKYNEPTHRSNPIQRFPVGWVTPHVARRLARAS